MMAENAGGVRRSLAHDESAREKQTPLTLRNEAQLNCVSLRPEFDCEVTWGAVKGQDERPLRGALDSSPSHHRRSMQLGKELIKDGRHVGLDFLRPSHRSIQTIREVIAWWLKPKSECNRSSRYNLISQIRRQVMRWLKTPRNPARRISCDSAGHREATAHGKELRHRWLRLAKE